LQKNSPNFSQHQKRVGKIFFCKEYYRWWGAWSYLLKKVLHSEVDYWKSWRMLQLWLLSLFLLENLFIILVWCHLLFLQWKSILIRTSQKRRWNIIYTSIACLFLFQKWSNPHHSPLLKSWTKIDFSIFASNLSNCGHAFFNVDEAPSFETEPLHLEDLQYGYLEWATSFKLY